MKVKRVALIVAAVVTVAGCGQPGAAAKQETRTWVIAPPSISTTPFTNSVPVPWPSSPVATQPVALSPQGGCTTDGDLQGKFTEAQMQDYAQCIVPGVDQWVDDAYKDGSMPHPSRYYFIPVGAQGMMPWGCPYYDTMLNYCPTDRSIYVGARAAWKQYSDYGDAAMALIMAHEVTHHMQLMRGMTYGQNARGQIEYENQADCGGGAFVAFGNRKEWMDKDDINDFSGALKAAGMAEGPNRQWGTPDERVSAFEKGYNATGDKPLAACNDYVSGIQLVPTT